MPEKTIGQLFWGNVDDCLIKYKVSKVEFSTMIYRMQGDERRKTADSIYNSVRASISRGTYPSNFWGDAVKKAIRVIDTDNLDTPVEFCDLFTDGFFK